MLRKLSVGILALLAVAPSWGQGPWIKKSYKQWNEKDVRKTLNDSPWVKGILVDAPWRGISVSGKRSVPSSSFPPPGGALADPEDSASESGPGSSAVSSSPGGTQLARVPVVILWSSSHTIRAALARSAVLHGTSQESDAETYIAQQPPEYEIVVQGQDLAPFMQSKESELQGSAFLLLKNSKTKLTPSQVRIQHALGGKEITSVVFSFPKRTARGEPAIGPGEKLVEFRCEAGGTVFQTSFELLKMIDRHGRDL